ncbi:MAG: 2-oxo acid dehydrogenase subunit E2 [Solirubrobacteraceae bacterium]
MAGPGEPTVATGASGKGHSSDVELSRAQQTTARRMAESKATIPHLTLQIDVEMDACLALGAKLGTVTHSDMVVKACALALREHPTANASYRDGRMQLHSRVNLGITVATADALVVPTVFDADRKPLQELAGETRALAERVHAGSVSPPELSGATFTVSDLGQYGVLSFAAIINPPQAGILATGALERRAVVLAAGVDADTAVVARNVITLTLSCDHRVLYGAGAARFLASIRELLEAPAALTV